MDDMEAAHWEKTIRRSKPEDACRLPPSVLELVELFLNG